MATIAIYTDLEVGGLFLDGHAAMGLRTQGLLQAGRRTLRSFVPPLVTLRESFHDLHLGKNTLIKQGPPGVQNYCIFTPI